METTLPTRNAANSLVSPQTTSSMRLASLNLQFPQEHTSATQGKTFKRSMSSRVIPLLLLTTNVN